MLEELRKALRRRGAEGMRTITRSFKLADSNKDGSVELAEFLVLAERCRLGLSDAEAASLHGHFDKDGSGKIDSEEFLEIFTVSDEGAVTVDAELADKLDELGVGYKSARGDRPTALIVPETEDYGQQKLGMTRTLGDFYMQHHGCTFEPAVSCIDLYVFAGQSNVLGWGVGPLEMQRVLSAHRRLAGGAPVLLFEPLGQPDGDRGARRRRRVGRHRRCDLSQHPFGGAGTL